MCSKTGDDGEQNHTGQSHDVDPITVTNAVAIGPGIKDATLRVREAMVPVRA